MVFDSSSAHGLQRRNVCVRDSVTFNYYPGRPREFMLLQVHPGGLATHRAELERLKVIAE